MRKRILVILNTFFLTTCSHALSLTFTEDGEIHSGNYWHISVRNEARLKIYGGSSDWLIAEEASRVELHGGSLAAGSGHYTYMEENSSYFQYGGTNYSLRLTDNAKSSIFDGYLNHVRTYHNTSLSIFGGDIGVIFSVENSKTHIYGNSFRYYQTDSFGNHGIGYSRLTGFYGDGSSFDISLLDIYLESQGLIFRTFDNMELHWVLKPVNHVPVADAGPDQTVYAWFDGMAKVILDGTDSYDDDNHPLTYNWAWNVDGNSYDANGVNPIIELPVGEHLIELIVSDGIDDSEPNEIVITVLPAIETAAKLTPKVLNTDSHGNWIKAHFTLSEGYSVYDVDVNTPATMEPLGIESEHINVFVNEDGLVEIKIDFDRSAICGSGLDYGPAEIAIVGMFTSGQYFYGIDIIKITTNSLNHIVNLASHWLEAGCDIPDWCSGADIDHSSIVNFVDFALFDGCCIEVVK